MLKKKIDNYIIPLLTDHGIPGLSVSVVKDNKTIISSGYGVKNTKTSEDVSNNSLFHTASVSKPFTATAVMQLVEQGKIDINDPVIKHLPNFRMDDKRFSKITIQQMLSHLSGMPDETNYHWDKPEFDRDALERYVRSCKNLKLIAAPGERFFYSNIAYEILGNIIANVSGLPFEEYIRENIFDPLNMKSSTFLKEEIPSSSLVSPHIRLIDVEISSVYPYNRAHAPSSTLKSNSDDISKWMKVNLNRGVLDAKRILKDSSYNTLWKSYQLTGKNNEVFKSIGLSWFIGSFQGYETISHGGNDLGFSAFLVMLPEKNLGVTVFCNLYPSPAAEIARGVLDIMLGKVPETFKVPVIYPLLKLYKKEGLEAVINRYKLLLETKRVLYDFSIDSILKISKTFLEADKVQIAIDFLNLGVFIESENSNVYELLARAFFQSGNMDKAIVSAQRSLELNPDNPFLMEQMNRLQKEE